MRTKFEKELCPLCPVCGKASENTDHLDYSQSWISTPSKNLQPLCRRCHLAVGVFTDFSHKPHFLLIFCLILNGTFLRHAAPEVLEFLLDNPEHFKHTMDVMVEEVENCSPGIEESLRNNGLRVFVALHGDLLGSVLNLMASKWNAAIKEIRAS